MSDEPWNFFGYTDHIVVCYKCILWLMFCLMIVFHIPIIQLDPINWSNTKPMIDHGFGNWFLTLLHIKAGFILHTRAYADYRRSCLYFCRRLRPAHTPTVAVKVQTCWTFKASADQRRHSSQSRKRSKVTEGWRVVLHRDVCRRIPTHTLACLYFYPRRNLRYAVAMGRQPQAWTSAPAAGAYARMEYKPGLRVNTPVTLAKPTRNRQKPQNFQWISQLSATDNVAEVTV